MKKPYLKKYADLYPFSIWIVDGFYIRNNIDEEFTNFGQHYRFPFIPKYEFWIDKEYGNDDEKKFYIEHLLTEFKLMSKGMDYNKASEIADKIQKREREKSKIIEELSKKYKKNELIMNKIHKKLLKKYSHKKLKVWIVNGNLVRDFFYLDFTEGGHHKVFDFIPENEIWIDDDLNPKERLYVLLHELHERNLMKEKRSIKIKNGIPHINKDYIQNYNKAHNSASKIEWYCRHHPERLKVYLKKEFEISKKIN